ncbi:MAG: hypothetical protein ABI462_01190 [Ignavibacteria bacterium]
MHKKFLGISFCIMIITAMFSFSNVYALNWYQITTINNNRSGKIKINYLAKASDVKGSEFYKGLPFTKEAIKSTFGSDNNVIGGLSINTNNPTDISISFEIAFKDIQKIISAPGFSKSKITWYKNGDSTVFLYLMEKKTDFSADDQVVYTFVLPTTDITSTTGKKAKDNTVTYGLNIDNLARGASFVMTFKNSKDNTEAAGTDDTSKTNSGKGGCGLFGIELPLLFGLGMFFVKRSKKK